MARRHEILEIIKDHKSQTKGDGPSYRELLKQVNRRGYKMCLGTLRRHIDHLVDDALLLDPPEHGGKLIIAHSIWFPEDDKIPDIA